MEIVGIGSDIVECMRIGRMVDQHGEQFLTRVFTEREIQFCQSRKHAMQHFAGRWAAKEAVWKCLGAGGRRGASWTELEIRNDAQGLPRVHVCGTARDRARALRVSDILITVSHCRAYATATAIAVRHTGADLPAAEPAGD
jgi:holo-[acyl-carrier protein] synthase